MTETDTAIAIRLRMLEEMRAALLALAENDLREAAYRVSNVGVLASDAGLFALCYAAGHGEWQLRACTVSSDPRVKSAVRRLMDRMVADGLTGVTFPGSQGETQ